MHLNPGLKRCLLIIALAALIYPMTQLEVFARRVTTSDPKIAEKCTNAVNRAQARLTICTAKAVLSSSRRDDDRDKRRGGMEPADCADQYARKLDKIRHKFLWDKGLDPELCGLEPEGPDGPGLIGKIVKRFFGEGPRSGSTGAKTTLLISNINDPASESITLSQTVQRVIEQRRQPVLLGSSGPTPSNVPTDDCYCGFPLYPTDGWCMPPGSFDTNGVWNGDFCIQQDLCGVTTYNQAGETRTGILYTDANGDLRCDRGAYTGDFCGAPYTVELDLPVCGFAAFECNSPEPAISVDNSGNFYYSTPNFAYGPHASGDTMQPGETLVPFIMSSNGEFTLLQQNDSNDLNGVLGLYRNTDGQLLWRASGITTIMQADGNLVSYGYNSNYDVVTTFASNTSGNPGSYLAVEDDGYAAVYSPDGTRLWSTKTGPPATGDTMQAGEMLDPSIESANGLYTLIYQSDGNLVLYPNGSTNALWASGTNGSSRGSAIMQTDGNFVVYDQSGNAVFAAGTAGNPGSRLVLQNDGNFVIYAPDGTALWATNTVQ